MPHNLNFRSDEPEFDSGHRRTATTMIVAKDHIRSIAVPEARGRTGASQQQQQQQLQQQQQQPLILTRREFDKILQASKVLRPSQHYMSLNFIVRI